MVLACLIYPSSVNLQGINVKPANDTRLCSVNLRVYMITQESSTWAKLGQLPSQVLLIFFFLWRKQWSQKQCDPKSLRKFVKIHEGCAMQVARDIQWQHRMTRQIEGKGREIVAKMQSDGELQRGTKRYPPAIDSLVIAERTPQMSKFHIQRVGRFL